MNRYGQPYRKTTIWLGSDDGDPGGMQGYGYDISREDSMVSIEYVGNLSETEDHEQLQVFILPDLFPAIRAAMDAAGKTLAKKGRKA